MSPQWPKWDQGIKNYRRMSAWPPLWAHCGVCPHCDGDSIKNKKKLNFRPVGGIPPHYPSQGKPCRLSGVLSKTNRRIFLILVMKFQDNGHKLTRPDFPGENLAHSKITIMRLKIGYFDFSWKPWSLIIDVFTVGNGRRKWVWAFREKPHVQEKSGSLDI